MKRKVKRINFCLLTHNLLHPYKKVKSVKDLGNEITRKNTVNYFIFLLLLLRARRDAEIMQRILKGNEHTTAEDLKITLIQHWLLTVFQPVTGLYFLPYLSVNTISLSSFLVFEGD